MDDEVVEGIPRGPSPLLGPARPGCLPFRLFMIMQVIATAFVAPPPFSCVDCFAARRAISRAFVGHGEPAVALDILLTPDDDSWVKYMFCIWGLQLFVLYRSIKW